MNATKNPSYADLPAQRAKAVQAFFKVLRKAMANPLNKRLGRHNDRAQTPPPGLTSSGISEFSCPPVKDSSWCSQNFLLGAGMVIIQPSTNKVVLLYRSDRKYYFLPKGRKDIGESLEQAALREAYEEAGYKVEFLPLLNPSCALAPPHDPDAINRPNTEPIFSSITSWAGGWKETSKPLFQGEYFTFWFVGQIGSDAVYQKGTGMANEQSFSSHLFTYEEAMQKIWGVERKVLEYAWAVYLSTTQFKNVDETN